MTTTIEYRENGTLVGRMNEVQTETVDAACLIAQKYMAQFPSIDAAHVLTEKTERIVSKATEWQKRNG